MVIWIGEGVMLENSTLREEVEGVVLLLTPRQLSAARAFGLCVVGLVVQTTSSQQTTFSSALNRPSVRCRQTSGDGDINKEGELHVPRQVIIRVRNLWNGVQFVPTKAFKACKLYYTNGVIQQEAYIFAGRDQYRVAL